MNKKFFEGMKTFATVFLVLGLIGATVLLFTIVIVPSVNKYGSSTMDFSASGLGITVAVALGVVVGYYLLSGMARVGLTAYADEKDESNNEPLPKDFSYTPNPENKAEHSFTLEPGQYLSGRDFELGSYIAYASIGTLILKTQDGRTIVKYQLHPVGTRCFFNEDTIVIVDQKTQFVPQ